MRLAGTTPGQAGAVDVTSGSTFRMKQADNPTSDTNNPIPAVGTLDSNASVSCWWCTTLNVTVAAATAINNIKWYGNNPTLQTGLKLRGEGATGYVQAPTTGLTFGGAGEAKVANYATMTAPVDLATTTASGTYTSGAMKTMTSAAKDNTTGYISGGTFIFVYQLQVASTASPGVMSPIHTATWQYDET
jgi:hypothetical protein